MNEAGELQKDVMLAKFAIREGTESENLTAIVNECVAEKGANECETAFKVYECYRTKRAAAAH